MTTTTEQSTWRPVLEAVSWLVGWTYFTLWTLSFYPQLLQNHSRRSTLGVATSYFPLNILGFLCYTLYTSLLLYSPVIRAEYAARYPNAPNPTVRFNDLAFALHAFIIASVTYSQFFPWIWGYEAGRRRERTIPFVWGVIIGIISTIAIITAVAVGNESEPHDPDRQTDGDFFSLDQINYLDITTAFSLSKLLVTLIKYLPQIYTNYLNKSTEGFSIYQILLDFFGGLLSLVQLGIDAGLEGSWEGVTGNLVKTGLGLISMGLNIVFMTQHYLIYRGQKQDPNNDDDYDYDEDGDREGGGREEAREVRRDERTPLVGHLGGRYQDARDLDGDISE
ncbi:Cystinosin [Arthrobotrys entomopaga]|nr:Cystinosin [Arthrobotrys entomopaga]